jgi:hypothetical protein
VSSLIVRKLGSVPSRTATETWEAIVELLAEPDGAAEAEMLSVAGIASMLIADEYCRDVPIVVTPGSGSRVRVYTVHGDGTDEVIADESPLASWPTTGATWALSIPCDALDLPMARNALANALHISVRDISLGLALDEAEVASESVATTDRVGEPRIDTSWLSR